MTFSDELFFSILSMDSYDRAASPDERRLDVGSARVGNATPTLNSDQEAPSENYFSDGFFAQAYDWDGKTVISYEGTNDGLVDVWNGWVTGAGIYSTSQAHDAARFYQDIVRANNSGSLEVDDLYSAQIILTGHSLGGGLAGFLASIYGQEAYIYDNMPFEGAATDLYNQALFVPQNEGGVSFVGPTDSQASQFYYLGASPELLDRDLITAVATTGEPLLR